MGKKKHQERERERNNARRQRALQINIHWAQKQQITASLSIKLMTVVTHSGPIIIIIIIDVKVLFILSVSLLLSVLPLVQPVLSKCQRDFQCLSFNYFIIIVEIQIFIYPLNYFSFICHLRFIPFDFGSFGIGYDHRTWNARQRIYKQQ